MVESHPPSLRREITPFGGLLITLSNLSPSIGVFIVGNQLLHQIGSGAIVCLAGALVVCVAMAAVYAELGSAFPHPGGEYTLAGRVLGPTAAFAMLAGCLTGNCIATALSSLGVADYLRVVLPAAQTVPTALVCVAAVTGLSLLSLKMNEWVTGSFLAAEMLGLGIVAVLGFSHLHAAGLGLLVHPGMPDAAGGLKAVPLGLLGVAGASGIYTFNGYGGVIYFGEELRGARRGVARVVYWALGIGAVTILLPMVGLVVGAPDFGRLSASASPLPEFLAALGGPILAKWLSFGVAGAIFNTMIAIALIGSRQIFATARDRVWPEPMSRQLEKIHPRFGSPWVATLVFGGVTACLCFVPLSWLVIIIANGTVATYAMLALAVMVGRRNGSTAQSRSRMKFFPLAPVVVLVAMVGVAWADLLDPVTGQVGFAATFATLGSGAFYYWAVLRRGGRWAHRAGLEEDAGAI